MMELKPAYITIVEGPPPEFQEATNYWVDAIMESQTPYEVAVVEMRTFDGEKLVQRCEDAWADGRPARLDFPLGDGNRGELDIVAARWDVVEEGPKLFLWVSIGSELEFDEDVFSEF